MGVRILSDRDSNIACLYCSTSDVAFGPVFSDGDEHDADERAEAFCRWFDSDACDWRQFDRFPYGLPLRRDLRQLTDAGLQQAYTAWLAQEADQQTREHDEESRTV